MSGDSNSNSMPKSMNQEDSLETQLADIQKNQRQQNQNQNRGDGNQAAAAARESEYKETVSKRFDKTYQTFKNFEDMDMSDPNTQNQLSQLIKDLEEITQTISSLDFFSKNESLDEINPAKLKFLLLPYLLASAWQMKRHAERSEVCRICKIYLDDFIERALDFLIISKPPAVWLKSKNLSSDSEEKQSQRSSSNSLTPEQKRAQKIEQYRLNKEYDSRIQALTERVGAGEDIDDSTYKELYLTLIKRACVDAEAQLENVLTELEMLAYRAKMMKNGNPNPQPTPRPPQLGPELPYQTFILTRSEVEKKVFGLGYPSIPAMTVEELYEQRIKDGTWTQGHGGQQGPSANSAPQQEQDEEVQKAEEELLEEIDDMNLRESLRARDEYRDEHRRGWGNRMNRS